MKLGFYPKLAFDGIRKNKRMYVPYILTCIGMVTMYYIMVFLQYSEAVSSLRGGATIREMLGFGGWVIAIFSCIFLFYTNSFLIRRRKKEFGLYNILGMGKWNIGRILLCETVILALISLVAGLFLGISLSKLAELGLVNVMQGGVSYTFFISPFAILMSVLIFAMIFGLLFLNSVRQVHFSSAISLIRSENVGEKPPKGNWFFGILGLLILAAAYYLAVTIKNPVEALAVFFIAVIMVILGTYLIMISGSVLLCRILQKKKSYYYKPNHFVSVSSMAYRMKRNGAGLASICILATMVLVITSSTTSLYFGEEDSLNFRFPREIDADFTFTRVGDLSSSDNTEAIREEIKAIAAKHGISPQNVSDYRYVTIGGLLTGTNVEVDITKVNTYDYSDVYQFYFIPLEDYNATMGTDDTLSDGEALLYISRGSYTGDTISFNEGQSFRIKKQVESFVATGNSASDIVTTIMLFVPDIEDAIEGLATLADYNGDRMINLRWTYYFDTGLDADGQIELRDEIYQSILGGRGPMEKYGVVSFSVQSREDNRQDFFSLYGGLFYLGIILSIVFIFAAVLIIYYKQISEGYEDQRRFEIMQKVGMTGREIRKSINSQLLTVFFLPLAFAACHLAFAFPIIHKLLLLFNLINVMLFALTTVISVVVFALFYTLIYRVTSNAYYNIVSGAKERE